MWEAWEVYINEDIVHLLVTPSVRVRTSCQEQPTIWNIDASKDIEKASG